MRPFYKEPPEGHGDAEVVGPGGMGALCGVVDGLLELIRTRQRLSTVCESPIEIDLGARLIVAIKSKAIEVCPQYRWLQYRMDFACLFRGSPILFIECDGREFHSTNAQIANDQAKDSAAKAAGISLLRFTGSDIFRQPDACVRIIIIELGQQCQRSMQR